MNVTNDDGGPAPGSGLAGDGKVLALSPCRDVAEGKNRGLSVDEFDPYHLKEGFNISLAFGQLALINRAPHPKAAKVFINWLLSREGQIAFQKVLSQPEDKGEVAYQKIINTGTSNSLRIDIPKSTVLPDHQRVSGGNYVVTERPEWMEMKPILQIVDEVCRKR